MPSGLHSGYYCRMDNITHTVVGLGLGALIDHALPIEPDPAQARIRTRMLLVVAALASNLPDADLLLAPLLEQPLGYLLHHRGHTHTLVGAALQTLFLTGLVWLLWPAARRLQRSSSAARLAVPLAAAAGLLLHVGMDGLNVYGVHPFWPFDPGWYYGDLVFIVEPVFWIACGVPLAMLVRSAFLRRLWLTVLLLVPIAAAWHGFLAWGTLAGLLALGLLLGQLAARKGGRAGRMALAAGAAGCLAWVGIQALALQQAHSMVAAEIARIDPGERLLDTALTAYPANPLCWSFVTVATGAAGDVHLRRGMLSLAPGLAPVSHCPAGIAGPALEDAPPRLAWQAEQRQPLAALRRLAASDCRLNAWLRFARAPSLTGALVTDLRWGEPGDRNFTTMALTPGTAPRDCPHPVPGWGYPRADLLFGR